MRMAEETLERFYLAEATWKRGRNWLCAAAAAGWIACAMGYAAEPRRFAASYLVAFLFFVTIALGGLFFVMVQHLSGAVWSVTSRRTAENIMAVLPAAAVLFLPVAFNLHALYEWTHAEAVAADALLRSKRAWLNTPAYLARSALYLLVWGLLSRILLRRSLQQDATGGAEPLRGAARWSAAGMVLALLTGTGAAFDWIMSLEPHWYSTVFGVYVYSGATVAFVAALITILLLLRRAERLSDAVRVEHYHDLGKWLFALTVFWAYIAFSQYMLIWYANLPEETFWFRKRISGGWRQIALLLVAGHFLLPFFALLSRAAKRHLKLLGVVAGWMLVMHYADLYWQVMPVFHPGGPTWHWLDAAAWAAVGASLGLVFWSKLRRTAMVPLGDPRLAQSLEFRNV